MTTHELANLLLSRPDVEVVTPGSEDTDMLHPIIAENLIDASINSISVQGISMDMFEFADEGKGKPALIFT